MTLTERITFERNLQKDHRLQIPKVLRWQFKMETNQVLSVGISIQGSLKDEQYFYAKMEKDGRISVPPLVVSALKRENPNLSELILEVTIDPLTNDEQENGQ